MTTTQKADEPLIGKVLFVDDETSILKSLQRRFLQEDFSIFTAPSGPDGLEILDKEDIDIVVTDYRMPGMDGIKFLEIAKEKHPTVSRVILSGFVERSAVIRSLTKGLTTTYFAKPWDDVVLRERIKHILVVRKMLRSKELLRIVNSIEKLPALPTIYQRFIEAVDNDRSIKEIAKIIEQDTSVATKVLQVANSAFYGLKGTPAIDHAMVYLGLNSVKDILLAISLTNQMDWNAAQREFLQEIFRHSSLVNRYIPKIYQLCFDTRLNEQYRSVGLTHDIGKIILLQYYPDRYELTLSNQKRNAGMTFYESEQDLGFKDNTHTEIGAYFLDWWNLPEAIVEVALFHHMPESSSDHYREILNIAIFTDKLINMLLNDCAEKEIDLYRLKHEKLSKKQVEELILEIKEELSNEEITPI